MKRLILGSLSILLISSGAAIAEENQFTDSKNNPQITAQVTNNNLIVSSLFITTEQDHPTSGMATIIKENGQHYLVFDENFTTATGPDVQVVLNRNSPVPVKLQEENYTTIAPLKSTDGKQRYAIPDNIDLKNFEAVSIWCRKFNVSFGYAALN